MRKHIGNMQITYKKDIHREKNLLLFYFILFPFVSNVKTYMYAKNISKTYRKHAKKHTVSYCKSKTNIFQFILIFLDFSEQQNIGP